MSIHRGKRSDETSGAALVAPGVRRAHDALEAIAPGTLTEEAVAAPRERERVLGSVGSPASANSAGGGAARWTSRWKSPRRTFYQITVGTHGGPSYSFEEMQSTGFNVQLSLDG